MAEMSNPVQAFARQVVDAFGVPRRIVFTELTDEDIEHDRALQRYWDLELAWRAWRLASCVEFNDGHDVRLRFHYGDWSIVCAHGCPLELDDYYPDGTDVVFADLPVTVEVETVHHRGTPDHGDEWSITIGLEPRNG